MTSPVQDKPDNTTSIYADVYAPGLSNSYGQNLRKGTPAETERAVKDLFLQQAASPFQGAMENFLGTVSGIIGDIASAIRGDGGAKYQVISGAVNERLGPLDSVIQESGLRMEELSQQVDDRIEDQEEGLSQIQEEATRTFARHQTEINRLVQEQLWSHQDMIELLDIRAQKQFGSHADQPQASKPLPYKGNETHHWWETPYLEIWRAGHSVYYAAKGAWIGTLKAEINWTGGQIDQWVVEVTPTSRVFHFSGGNTLIEPRHIAATVQPTSLCRRVTIARNSTPSGWVWSVTSDPNNLVRSISDDGKELRLKNNTTATRPVRVRRADGSKELYGAGTQIPSTVLYAEDQSDAFTSAGFAEVADPSADYTVPSGRPGGSAIEIQ